MAKVQYDVTKYDRPSVTVDIVIFTIQEADLKVLLVKRGTWPYKGRWAIPGGFIHMDEGLDEAARRELYEETGVKDVFLEQLYTFGDPRRDPRTRVITVAYYALVNSDELKVRPDTDVREVRWVSVYRVGKLAFDHNKILEHALERLRNKLMYSDVAFNLLGEQFTLTHLQQVYEIILHRSLDKRNFRKRILALGVVEETGETLLEGRHRPARLYRFRENHVEVDAAAV